MNSRMRSKQDLPSKLCLHCGRSFTWRKKWQRCWDEVRYCSDRCRNERKAIGSSPDSLFPPTA